MRLRSAAPVLCLLLCLSVAGAEGRSFTGYRIKSGYSDTLGTGVSYARYWLIPPDRNVHRGQRIFLIDVAAGAPARLTAVPSAEGFHRRLRTLADIVGDMGDTEILGAVNGDFFDTAAGGPVGYLMRDGEWLAAGEFPDGWACGMTADGQAVIGQPKLTMTLGLPGGHSIGIDALNGLRGDCPKGASSPSNVWKARMDNRLVLYTPAFGSATATQAGGVEVTLLTDAPLAGGTLSARVSAVTEQREAGGAPLESGCLVLSGISDAAEALRSLKPGDTVTVTLNAEAPFDRAADVTGGGRPDGGPLLILGGEAVDLAPAKALADDPTYFYRQHPRTAMGIRADGSWFLLAVEGNRSGSYGMTLEMLQTLLLDLGADIAMNLDGGPSTTMLVRRDGQLKAVTDTAGGQGRLSVLGCGILVTE